MVDNTQYSGFPARFTFLLNVRMHAGDMVWPVYTLYL